ncbi:hypothetical protein CsSME_00006285 [Camellia sinensis var. sinensis]
MKLLNELKPFGFKLRTAFDGDDVTCFDGSSQSIQIGNIFFVAYNCIFENTQDLEEFKRDRCFKGNPVGWDGEILWFSAIIFSSRKNCRGSNEAQESSVEDDEESSWNVKIGCDGGEPVGDKVEEEPIRR